MKIEGIRIREEEILLTRPYTIATGTYDRVTNFVVELRAGRFCGMGIASQDEAVTGETAEMCRRASEQRHLPMQPSPPPSATWTGSGLSRER